MMKDEWLSADVLRHIPETMLDQDEEEALNIVLVDDLYPYLQSCEAYQAR